MMEMVSASVEETDLDKLIHDMFQNAGLGDKEALSLDDFIAVMAEHKDELNNAKLDIAGMSLFFVSTHHELLNIIKEY